MVAIASQQPKRQPSKKKISWETFQKQYLTREDKFKYEWVDGYIEKTPRTMDKNQSYIFNNLANFLDELKRKQPIEGRFISEVDTFFANQHRRPDIIFFTQAQIRAAKENKAVVPQFVIEIISSTDQINRVKRKMKDYRAAAVPVIWLIYPALQEVHVYRGKDSHVCEETDICSAAEVIKGFKLSVNDIFR